MPKTLTAEEIEAFRERIIDVAEQLFGAHGPDGVTMRQLADALGVSSMTAYRYYPDKDAILAAVRTRAFSRFAAYLEGAWDRAMRGERGKAGNAYIDFALANPASYRMMFDTSQPTTDNYPDLVASMTRARATMTIGWKELAKTGRLAGDVELIAHLHWSALHGAVMLQLAGLLAPPLDAYAIAAPTLEALAKQAGLLR